MKMCCHDKVAGDKREWAACTLEHSLEILQAVNMIRRSDSRADKTRRVDEGPKVRKMGSIGLKAGEPGAPGNSVKRWLQSELAMSDPSSI